MSIKINNIKRLYHFRHKETWIRNRDMKRRCKAHGAGYTGKAPFRVEFFGVHSPRLAAKSSYRRKPVSRKPEWIPPYQIRGRLSLARNDGPMKEDDRLLLVFRPFIFYNAAKIAQVGA